MTGAIRHTEAGSEQPAAPATRDMTIIRLGSGTARQVREVVQEWTTHGLVKDSLWVNDVVDTATATLLTKDGYQDVNVQEELHSRDLKQLRVVSLGIAASDGDISSLPSGEDENDAQHAYRALAAETSISFTGGGLFAVLPHLQLPESCLFAGWEFNLIVSSEDRAVDDRIGVELNSKSLPLVVASALVTVSGMWRWSTEAIIDSLAPQMGSADPETRLVRTYVRLVDGGYLLDQVVEAALSLDRSSGSWPVAYGGNPPHEHIEDPERSIRRIAEGFIESFDLRFTPFEVPPPPPPRPFELWEGIKLFFRTALRIATNKPLQILQRAEPRVNEELVKFFQARTFGADSSVVLTLRGYGVPRMPAEPTGIERLRQISDGEIPGSDVIIAEPQLWVDFRRVACGLADGAEFPEGMSPPTRGASRALVTAPDWIAPDPDTRWSFKDDHLPGMTLLPTDAFAAAELERCLTEVIEQKEQWDQDKGPANDSAQIAVRSDKPENEEAETLLSSAENRKLDTGRPIAGKPTWSNEDLEPYEAPELKTALDALHQWLATRHRRSSFVWRVGGAIGQASVDASQELADALETIERGEEAPEPNIQERSDARRLIRRFFRATVGVTVALLAIVVVVAISGALVAIGAAILGILLLLGCLVTLFGRFARFITSETRAEFERTKALSVYWSAYNRAYVAARGVSRFCSLYWQYLDWAAVLGKALRSPWGEPAPHASEEELTGLPHPLSMIIGKGEVLADQFQRCVSGGRQLAMVTGWLHEALERQLEFSSGRYQHIMHVRAPEADADRDTERPSDGSQLKHAGTGERLFTPRVQARHDIEEGRFGRQMYGDEASKLAGTLLQAPEELVMVAATPPSSGVADSAGSLTDFLSMVVPTAEHPACYFPQSSYRDETLERPEIIDVSLSDTVPLLQNGMIRALSPQGGTLRYGDRLLIGAQRVDLGRPRLAREFSQVCLSSGSTPASKSNEESSALANPQLLDSAGQERLP